VLTCWMIKLLLIHFLLFYWRRTPSLFCTPYSLCNCEHTWVVLRKNVWPKKMVIWTFMSATEVIYLVIPERRFRVGVFSVFLSLLQIMYMKKL
jgi:hypothetical protein